MNNSKSDSYCKGCACWLSASNKSSSVIDRNSSRKYTCHLSLSVKRFFVEERISSFSESCGLFIQRCNDRSHLWTCLDVNSKSAWCDGCRLWNSKAEGFSTRERTSDNVVVKRLRNEFPKKYHCLCNMKQCYIQSYNSIVGMYNYIQQMILDNNNMSLDTSQMSYLINQIFSCTAPPDTTMVSYLNDQVCIGMVLHDFCNICFYFLQCSQINYLFVIS